MGIDIRYVVRARLDDTTIKTYYCVTKKEAYRAFSCYLAIDSVLEVVVNDYSTLEVLSHCVKRGVKPFWGRGVYGTF